MKTYLTIWFSSEGERPSEIVAKLKELGFKPVKGNYDFVYDWARDVNVEEILALSDEVQRVLKNSGVMFKLETI